MIMGPANPTCELYLICSFVIIDRENGVRVSSVTFYKGQLIANLITHRRSLVSSADSMTIEFSRNYFQETPYRALRRKSTFKEGKMLAPINVTNFKTNHVHPSRKSKLLHAGIMVEVSPGESESNYREAISSTTEFSKTRKSAIGIRVSSLPSHIPKARKAFTDEYESRFKMFPTTHFQTLEFTGTTVFATGIEVTTPIIPSSATTIMIEPTSTMSKTNVSLLSTSSLSIPHAPNIAPLSTTASWRSLTGNLINQAILPPTSDLAALIPQVITP
jgi:hypothetical protein